MTNVPQTEPIVKTLPTEAEAKQEKLVQRIVERSVTGDWADNSLDAVCGALLMVGVNHQGCLMWRQIIAADRARLVADKLDVLEIPAYEWEPAIEYFEEVA